MRISQKFSQADVTSSLPKINVVETMPRNLKVSFFQKGHQIYFFFCVR